MLLRLIIFCFILFPYFICAQNTIGLIDYDEKLSFPGYNLFYPNHQSSVFLLDGCGRLVHKWPDNSFSGRPGGGAYLLENGLLLRAKSDTALIEPSFGGGGAAGGVIELVDWSGEVKWQLLLADSLIRAHHDVHMMPNGNILAIVWEKKNFEEIIQMGFDTLTFPQTSILSDAIYEIDTQSSEIVWSWHAWDHLVQDFDQTKTNFSDPSAHLGRLDINYQQFSAGRPDWLHLNAVDYNEALDQIIVCSKHFNEVWIIDHSTTKSEAADTVGGASGRGGDLLFRWGNPFAYSQGTSDDRLLFQPHDAKWLDPSSAYVEGNGILLFNNFVIPSEQSLGQLIRPSYDDVTTAYQLQENIFLPLSANQSFTHPVHEKGYSALASSIQILPNGNYFMCAAQPGRSFEISPDGQLAWEYVTPLVFGTPVPQETQIPISSNFTNKMFRYPLDFPAFDGRDLSLKGFIELDPNTDFCEITTSLQNGKIESPRWKVFPNPASDFITIYGEFNQPTKCSIVNLISGRIHKEFILNQSATSIDIKSLPVGSYILKSINDKSHSQVFIIAR